MQCLHLFYDFKVSRFSLPFSLSNSVKGFLIFLIWISLSMEMVYVTHLFSFSPLLLILGTIMRNFANVALRGILFSAIKLRWFVKPHIGHGLKRKMLEVVIMNATIIEVWTTISKQCHLYSHTIMVASKSVSNNNGSIHVECPLIFCINIQKLNDHCALRCNGSIGLV